MFDIDNVLANKDLFLANLNDGGDMQNVFRIYVQATPDGEGSQLSKPFCEIADAMMAGKVCAVQGYDIGITVEEVNNV